jgi:hypothetical protein
MTVRICRFRLEIYDVITYDTETGLTGPWEGDGIMEKFR